MFQSDFFIQNRAKFAESVPDALICIPAHCALQESADLTFPFRQDSNFWYLTGLQEPDLLLVINSAEHTSTLFLPEQNDYQKEWDGVRDTSSLQKQSGITDFRSRSEIIGVLRKAQKIGLKIAYLQPLAERVEPYGFYANPARRLLESDLKLVEPQPLDVRVNLARLRQVKQAIEIKAITRAIDVTATTLADVKERLGTFKTEKELENAITASFYAQHSEGHAYEPIIAGGRNASIIHYNHNNSPLKKGNLLLLDVGAKYEGYASDISRTWSLGKPSKRQVELYKTVQALQEEAFRALRPGVILREYQKVIESKAKQLFKNVSVVIDTYPHGFSHFLGLDVHDAGVYDEPLQEGCVLTVEPGVYLPNENIGIRIEDNVLITKNGIKNLSEHIPKVL